MIEKLRLFFDPNRSVPLFIIGTAALTLVLQALYDLANNPTTWQGGYLLALVAFVVAVAALIITSRRQPVPGRVNLADEKKPTLHRGLILLIGPRESAAPDAIEYHRDTLRHCWLISTQTSLTTAAALQQRFDSQTLSIHQGSAYVVDEDQIRSTYDLLMRIITEEAPRHGLTPNDLIGDITGGLKPMTAGMTLACLARHCDMQYMKILRNEAGEPLPGAIPEPIQIDAAFVPEYVPGDYTSRIHHDE